MATHSSILAWIIPRTEEPGEPQSMGGKESNMTKLVHMCTCMCMRACACTHTHTHTQSLMIQKQKYVLQGHGLKLDSNGQVLWTELYSLESHTLKS